MKKMQEDKAIFMRLQFIRVFEVLTLFREDAKADPDMYFLLMHLYLRLQKTLFYFHTKYCGSKQTLKEEDVKAEFDRWMHLNLDTEAILNVLINESTFGGKPLSEVLKEVEQ